MRGIVRAEFGQLADSLTDFERGVALAPNDAAMHANLGNTLRLLGRVRQGAGGLQPGGRARSAFCEGVLRRAAVLHQSERIEQALADCERVLALDPSVSLMASERLHLTGPVVRLARPPPPGSTIWRAASGQGETVGAWIVITALDDPELQIARRAAQGRSRLSHQAPTIRATSHERLRIAYLSPDFRDHPVAYQLVELIERHDKTRFETLWHLPARRPRMRHPHAHLPGVSSISRRRARAAMPRSHSCSRCWKIDIAVDLAGSAGHGRPKIFALRPAPIAVNYMGYPGTMGSQHLDLCAGRCRDNSAGERAVL